MNKVIFQIMFRIIIIENEEYEPLSTYNTYVDNKEILFKIAKWTKNDNCMYKW